MLKHLSAAAIGKLHNKVRFNVPYFEKDKEPKIDSYFYISTGTELLLNLDFFFLLSFKKIDLMDAETEAATKAWKKI